MYGNVFQKHECHSCCCISLGGPCELPLTGDLWDWEQKQPRNQGFIKKYYLVHESQCCKGSLMFYCRFICLTLFSFFQPSDDENSDNSNECVVCLSDLRDTLILPCRHLCLCNSCADTLRYQANNCPICRLRKKFYIIVIKFCSSRSLNNAIQRAVNDYMNYVFNFTLCSSRQPSEPYCRSELWGKSLALFPPCLSALFWLRLWTMTSTQ